MTDGPNDDHVDQLMKARRLAIGLSQTDLAEVLGATFQQAQDGSGANWVDAGRLMQVAEALDIPVDLLCSPSIGAEREAPDPSPAQRMSSLQSVLELRLLRAFQNLTDLRTQEVLVLLAEQIAKRQVDRGGDAG
jgi:transcriptional regulator with XRE-family HTH domain